MQIPVVILLALWAPTMVHAYRGSGYPVILVISAMFAAVQVVTFDQLYFAKHLLPSQSSQSSQLSTVDIWAYGIFLACDFALYNTGHFLLAWTYRTVAKTPMRQMNGLITDQKEMKKEQLKKKLLLTANLVTPFLVAASEIVLLYKKRTCHDC